MRRKELVLLVLPVLLLSACGQKEIVVQPIPDSTTSYNHIHTSVPIIDAIIDTEAEVRYIQEIQREYEKYMGYYTNFVSKSSGVGVGSNPATIQTTKEGLQELVKEIEQFKTRITTIDVPANYRTALLASLNAMNASLTSEAVRLSEKSESEPSGDLYQKAQDGYKYVQQVFQALIQV